MWDRSLRLSRLLQSVVAGIDHAHKFKSEKQTEKKRKKVDDGCTGSIKPETV